jgi:hypothetical protein
MISSVQFQSSDIRISNHALNSCRKREISSADIKCILKYGETIYKQGRTFHYIKKSDIPNISGLNSRLNDIVVIKSLGGNIITCYYNSRPQFHISKKKKRYSYLLEQNLFDDGFSIEEIELYSRGKINF